MVGKKGEGKEKNIYIYIYNCLLGEKCTIVNINLKHDVIFFLICYPVLTYIENDYFFDVEDFVSVNFVLVVDVFCKSVRIHFFL